MRMRKGTLFGATIVYESTCAQWSSPFATSYIHSACVRLHPNSSIEKMQTQLSVCSVIDSQPCAKAISLYLPWASAILSHSDAWASSCSAGLGLRKTCYRLDLIVSWHPWRFRHQSTRPYAGSCGDSSTPCACNCEPCAHWEQQTSVRKAIPITATLDP